MHRLEVHSLATPFAHSTRGSVRHRQSCLEVPFQRGQRNDKKKTLAKHAKCCDKKKSIVRIFQGDAVISFCWV